MKTIILTILAALAVLAQSVPPGGGKPTQWGIDDGTYTAAYKVNFVSGSGMGAYSKSCANGICTITFNASGGIGSGDVVGPVASVDGEVAIYNSTTGKIIKRMSGSGLGILTNGVLSRDDGLQWSNASKGIGVFGPITSGQTSTYNGKFSLNGITSGTVDIQPANAAGTWSLTLPTTGGTNGYFLQTNGSGVSTWAAAGDVTGQASSVDSEIALFSGTGGKTIKRLSGTGVLLSVSGVATLDDGLLFNTSSDSLGVVGNVTIGKTGTATGELKINGTTSGTVTVKTADAAGTWTMTLPADDGSANQLLQTNGSGVTSWVDAGAASMVYPGAGIAVSTGSAWTTSLTAPTGAIVGAGQANTWSTGAQDFGSATSLKVPTSAGAAPTTSGFVGYDSTANKFKAGVNGAAHTFVTADASGNAAIPGTVTTGDGTVAGEIVLAELDASAGAEYISLVGPDDRSTSLRLLLPTADPAAGNVLAFTAPSSNISTGSWINPATAASGGSLTTSGAYAATLTVTGATNVTLPTSGTLATTADPVFTGSTQIPNGTGPTVDAAGEIAVDTTTDQLQFYGGAKRALPSIKFFSIVLPSVDETTDDLLFMKLPYGITLVSINGIVSAATSATFNIQECNSSGASCADMATSDIAADTDGTETTSFSDGTAASGAWLKIDVASKSGTPGTLTVTVAYRVVVD